MDNINILSQTSSIFLILFISFIFVIIGVFYSKNYKGLSNYLVANRSIGTFSLTTSLVASALGAWILFGPASAATWGGMGSVIGYALGTAFPLFILFYLGEKIRKNFPKCKTLIEAIRLKFGNKLFKLILLLSIFYMTIFLIAEVTAVAMLLNYISGTKLWVTALIIISSSLIYTLYGGLRASIFTDNIQFIVFGLLLLIAYFYLTSFNSNTFSFEYIKSNKPILLSSNYLPNFTAGLTFFIAVAATNLFHQGNWQRVYAAKNSETLRKSLIISFFIIIPVVFYMGFTGMVAFSLDPTTRPDLGFFMLLLKEQKELLSLLVIVLGLALTISTVDTLVNAISSLIVVDGKATFKFNKKINYFNLSTYIILFLSFISFIVASKGYDILYLFLLADLFCCAFVITVFYSFYNKDVNEKTAYVSIIIGLIGGFLFFPTPDFSKSLLVGVLMPKELFAPIITQSLLFLSFVIATFLPFIVLKIKKF